MSINVCIPFALGIENLSKSCAPFSENSVDVNTLFTESPEYSGSSMAILWLTAFR